ncbi:MAG: hypothetical protein FWC40_07600 [Proteobacteria bacterium]|nr:hypothetical protein [Pseudomonadota bacterium]
MNKIFKISMIAAMALAVVACGDDKKDKDDSTKCTNDAKRCSASGIPEVCKDGAWKAQEACGEGKKCSAGACIDDDGDDKCTNDAKQCSEGGVPELCVNGEWKAQAACGEGKKCSGAGECIDDDGDDKCTNDAKQCSETGIPELCVNGEWKAQAACTGGATCDEGVCSGYELGADCDEDTFVALCDGNKAIYCCNEEDVGFVGCDKVGIVAENRCSGGEVCVTFEGMKSKVGCYDAEPEDELELCLTSGQTEVCYNAEGMGVWLKGMCLVGSNGKIYLVELMDMKYCSSLCTSATSCDLQTCSMGSYEPTCEGNVALSCYEDYFSDASYVFRWDCNAIEGATCVVEEDEETNSKDATCDKPEF